MIVGIGVDIVDVERFKWMIRRSPGALERLFTEHERTDSSGKSRSAESLAARFAAKEAVIKALGDVGELRPGDCEVITHESGRPELRITGYLAEMSEQLGVTRWHISLSHDAGQALAYVIATA